MTTYINWNRFKRTGTVIQLCDPAEYVYFVQTCAASHCVQTAEITDGDVEILAVTHRSESGTTTIDTEQVKADVQAWLNERSFNRIYGGVQ